MGFLSMQQHWAEILFKIYGRRLEHVWTNLYALTESDFKTKYYHSV